MNNCFQYKIEIEEHSAPLKEEVEVVIGTMRDYPPRRERRKSSLRAESQRRQRSASLASNVSNLSIKTNASDATSQPPDYSQLSSRTESLQSLETCKTKLIM
jgi:uncharacterized protein YlxW (UPF0749 family)